MVGSSEGEVDNDRSSRAILDRSVAHAKRMAVDVEQVLIREAAGMRGSPGGEADVGRAGCEEEGDGGEHTRMEANGGEESHAVAGSHVPASADIRISRRSGSEAGHRSGVGPSVVDPPTASTSSTAAAAAAPSAPAPASEAAATWRSDLACLSREALVEEVVRVRQELEVIERERQGEVDFQSSLLKSVGQAIICTDLVGKISYWNRAATEIYGWTEKEAIGATILTILRAANNSLAEAGPKIMEKLTKGDKWTGEWSIITKSGRVVDLMVVDTPIMDEQNELVGIIGVSTDITELKRKEAEILRLNAELEARVLERTQQLEHSNRRLREEVQEHLRAREHLHMVAKDMEESRAKIMQQAEKLEKLVVELRAARTEAESASRLKSQFLACMSHEIRTPMNAVIGMTNLILSTSLTEELRQYVETIRTSGDALLSIIDDILDLSKIEAGELTLEPRTFSPLLCVEEAVDMVAMKAQEGGLELVSFVHPSVPSFALSDPFRFRQVLTNLLSNALKFTERGEVTIEVRALPWGEEEEGQHLGRRKERSPLRAPNNQEQEKGGVPGSQGEGEGEGGEGAAGAPVFPTKLTFRTAAPVRLSPHAPLHRLLVCVRDTGIGIPPERMSRLFRPFSQGDSSTTRRFGGTGLGLVISKQLVEMLGGHIWVESQGENQGSTFSFTLALYPTVDPLPGSNFSNAPAAALPHPTSPNGRGGPAGDTTTAAAAAGAGAAAPGAGAATPLPETEIQLSLPLEERPEKQSGFIPSMHSPRWVPQGAEILLTVGPLPLLAGLHACVVDRSEGVRKVLAQHLEALGMRVTLCSSAGALLDTLASAATASLSGATPGEKTGKALPGDPDILVIDTQVPGMRDLWSANLIRCRAREGQQCDTGHGLRERRKIVKMCPYGTSNQILQGDEERELSEGRLGGCARGGVFTAVISKPVRQTHLTKALLLLCGPAPPSSAVAGDGPTSSGAVQGPREGQGQQVLGKHLAQKEPLSRASSSSDVPFVACGAPGVQQKEAAAATASEAEEPPVKKARRHDMAAASANEMEGTTSSVGRGKGATSAATATAAAGGKQTGHHASGGLSKAENPRPVQGRAAKGSSAMSVGPPATAAAGGGGGTPVGTGVVPPSMGDLGANGRMVAQGGPVGMTMASSSVSVSGSAAGTLLITGPGQGMEGTGLRAGMATKHPLSILLVEDNLINQKVACRMLSHMGYTVDVAVNGAEAIQALERNTFRYDLLFMDIQMPVMDGIEATQRIHAIVAERGCPCPRIVAMTANVLHSDRQQCLSAGMDGFLSKPIRVADLVATLEQTPRLPPLQEQQAQ